MRAVLWLADVPGRTPVNAPKISKAIWKYWVIATLAYVPNAVAANVLLSRLHQHTIGLLDICVAADVMIWGLCSRALGRWPW